MTTDSKKEINTRWIRGPGGQGWSVLCSEPMNPGDEVEVEDRYGQRKVLVLGPVWGWAYEAVLPHEAKPPKGW